MKKQRVSPAEVHLRARSQQLRKEQNRIATELDKIFCKENYPTLVEKYVGKHFKQINSLGGSSRGGKWPQYTKVLEIREKDIYKLHDESVSATCTVMTFEVQPGGEVVIKSRHRTYVHALGRAVPEAEFYEAYNNMIEKINQLPL